MHPSHSLIQCQLSACGYSPPRCGDLFLGFQCSVPDLCPCPCADPNSPTGIFTFSVLSTWIHLCKTESCLVDPRWDIFKLSFSEQPNPAKSQWMGPHLDLTVTWFHIPSILFSQRKIFYELTSSQKIPVWSLSYQVQGNLHFFCRSWVWITNFKAYSR